MFDPELFFAQAERLAQPGADEEDYRTAVSRVYYACHLTARNRLFGVDAAGWDPSGRRPSHWAVMGAVAASLAASRTDERIVERMTRLKLAREKADYVCDLLHPEVQEVFDDYNVGDWAGLANEELNLARSLLPFLRELAPKG